MGDFAADVASLGKDLRTELVLDGDAELIRLVRFEIRIEGFARARGDVINARIPRLREVLTRRRQRRGTGPGRTIHADSEDVGGSGAATGGVVPNDGGRPRTTARGRLQQSGREQRNQEGIDSVDPAKDARIASAQNSISAEVPGGSDARADSTIERVIGILVGALDVSDGRETKGWSISLTLERGLFDVIEVLFRGYEVVVLVHEDGLEATLGLVRGHFDRVANAVVQSELWLDAPAVGPVDAVGR